MGDATIDDVRVWLLTKAREEYWADRDGGKANSDPFAWAASRLSEDLVVRSVLEMIDDAGRKERGRVESWLRNSAEFMVAKCTTHKQICDKLADYIRRGVH